MSEQPFIHCYGIGPMHAPCLVRRQCLRHVSLKKVPFHAPAETRWHYCQGQGEHFIPMEKSDDESI